MPTRKNRVVSFPLPIRGLNTIDQFVGIDQGFARELTNYLIDGGALPVRPGVDSVSYNAALAATANSQVRWFDAATYVLLGPGNANAILHDGRIRELDTGAGAGTTAGTCQVPSTTVDHVSLKLLIGCQEPRAQTAPFALLGPTTAVLTPTNIRAGCSYRGRLYYTINGIIEYSGLAQIAGVMTGGTFDPTSFMAGQSIIRMFALVAQPGLSNESVFIIFGDKGRVLVYTGDNPGAATWQLLGSFDAPAPISNLGFVEIDSDIFVVTTQYCYWFRALLAGGVQGAYSSSPSRPIENLWRSFGWQGIWLTDKTTSYAGYFPNLDVILISPFSISSSQVNLLSTGQPTFAYFRKYNAWAYWTSTALKWPIVTAQDNTTGLLFTYIGGALAEMNRLLSGSMIDQAAGIDSLNIEATLKTSFYSQFDGMLNTLKGCRVWYQNSLNGNLALARSIFDYSDLNSPWGWYTQSTVTAINPQNYSTTNASQFTNAANSYNTLVGLYGSGGGVSVQVTQKIGSGETTAQSQKLLALTAVVEEGSEFF